MKLSVQTMAVLIALGLMMPAGAAARLQDPATDQEPITFEASGESLAAPTGPPKSASELFDRYVSAQETYDLALVDLYADDAKIKGQRINSDGSTRDLTFTGVQWKQLIQQLMPLAKATGDYDSFSEVTFTNVGERVRIRATRHAVGKNYDSSWSMVVGPAGNGDWLIFEEQIETKQ